MKCPKCQAKLLPVDGEMFCLQCGAAVMPKRGADISAPDIEETTDPLLQKAIVDSLGHEVKFKLPVSGAAPVKATKSFVSMRQVLAAPSLATAGPAMTSPVLRSFAASGPATPRRMSPGANGGRRSDAGLWAEALASQLARGIVALRSLPKAWVAGLAVFGVFLALNGAVYAGFDNRVYPGVRVGDVNLAGVPFTQLHARLVRIAKPVSLTVRVGTTSYELTGVAGADSDKLAAVETQVREAGHSTPLPLAGALETLVSKPLAIQRGLSTAIARAEAQKIVGEVNYVPAPAVVMVVAGKVLLINDKPGQSLDVPKTAAAIQAAYEKTNVLGLEPQKLQALITAGDFAGEVEKAQADLNLVLKVHVKSAVYQPSATQIGDWLVISGPGKGVTVNAAAVAAYVAGLPGRFDRVGVVSALTAAVSKGQGLDYTASTGKSTAVPKLASTAAVWPLAVYSYCLKGNVSDGNANKLNAVFTDKMGWALGGRVSMVKSENSCNFSINIMPTEAMANVDSSCKGQATCLSGNQIAISDRAWQASPAKWSGTLDAYRTELVNHEVGHWLGFQHSSCTASATGVATPILAAPDLVLSGCSPNWYAIPADQQRVKILPGFN